MSLGFVNKVTNVPQKISRELQAISDIVPQSIKTENVPNYSRTSNFPRLRLWNLCAASLHLTFAVIVIAVGNKDLNAPTYVSEYLINGDNNTWSIRLTTPKQINSLNLTWSVAGFFLLSFFFHLGNSILWNKRYEYALTQCYNPFRWIEYTFSAPLM